MTYKVNSYEQTAVRDGIVTFLVGRGFSSRIDFRRFRVGGTLAEYRIHAAAQALMEIGLALSPAPVVLHDVPDYAVAVGGPTRVVRINRRDQFPNYLAFSKHQL